VPEYTEDKKQRIQQVNIIEYADSIVIYYNTKKLLQYALPKDGMRNERFAPPDVNLRYQPRNRKKDSVQEEKALREMGPALCDYLDFVKSSDSGIRYKGQFTRQLYVLLRRMVVPLRETVIKRALEYRVNDIDTISRIAIQCLKKNTEEWPDIETTQDYMEREAYRRGRFSDEPGFDTLDSLLRPGDEDSTQNN